MECAAYLSKLGRVKTKVAVGAYLTEGLAERLRDAAYWERQTLSAIVEEAVEKRLKELERKRGSPYPRRPESLRTGRPAR